MKQDGILERRVLLKLKEIRGLFKKPSQEVEEPSHTQNFWQVMTGYQSLNGMTQ